MAKNIAFMSGKGGSGKTSLALSFAKSLADMGLKVLLIDCDMSTHGATFFMRPKIEVHRKSNSSILAVDDILASNVLPPYGFLNLNVDEHEKHSEKLFENLVSVENNYYFLPSDVSISNTKDIKYVFQGFDSFLKEEASECFDIIIMDCQAGYSDFTRWVLRNSNIALLVTEPDSVSAAANKALCFQLGVELDAIQVYQIFSKVTDDEAYYYSKVSTSAFFANLEPIIFDWELRRTFVYLTIPCAETVNIQFEKKILDIISVLLPEFKQNLDVYKEKINDLHRRNLQKQIQFLEYKRKKRKRDIIIDNALNICLIIAGLTGILSTTFLYANKPNHVYIIGYIVILIMLIAVLLFRSLYKKRISETDKEILSIKQELYDYEI